MAERSERSAQSVCLSACRHCAVSKAAKESDLGGGSEG